MGKKVKKIFSKVDPFTAKVIDPMLGESGLPNISGRNAAREQAEEQAKLTRQQSDEQQRMLQTMQNNMQVDLKADNLSNVVAGGSADAFEGTDPTRRRRRQGGLTAALQV